MHYVDSNNSPAWFPPWAVRRRYRPGPRCLWSENPRSERAFPDQSVRERARRPGGEAARAGEAAEDDGAQASRRAASRRIGRCRGRPGPPASRPRVRPGDARHGRRCRPDRGATTTSAGVGASRPRAAGEAVDPVEGGRARRRSWALPSRSARQLGRHVLVPRRPGQPVAVLAGGELVRGHARHGTGGPRRPGSRRPRPFGSETCPGCIVSVTSTTTSTLARFVVSRARPPSTRPRRVGVVGVHPQRTAGVALAPGRVAEDRVGGERPALAGREHERVVGVDGRRLRASEVELAEQLGDGEVHAARRRCAPGASSRRLVDGERRRPTGWRGWRRTGAHRARAPRR